MEEVWRTLRRYQLFPEASEKIRASLLLWWEGRLPKKGNQWDNNIENRILEWSGGYCSSSKETGTVWGQHHWQNGKFRRVF